MTVVFFGLSSQGAAAAHPQVPRRWLNCRWPDRNEEVLDADWWIVYSRRIECFNALHSEICRFRARRCLFMFKISRWAVATHPKSCFAASVTSSYQILFCTRPDHCGQLKPAIVDQLNSGFQKKRWHREHIVVFLAIPLGCLPRSDGKNLAHSGPTTADRESHEQTEKWPGLIWDWRA